MVEWWPEYKCPKCGYSNTTTNLCRRCNVWMCSTGREHKFITKKDGSLRSKWRKMTKESELYNDAIFASFAFKKGIEMGDWKGPVPDWAWFGEESLHKEGNIK